jgi:hypothetical protein
MSSKPSFLALALVAAAAAPRTALAIPASFPAGELVRDRWSTRDGLPVSGVGAVRASVGGYLWLGTDEGLVRFDGSRFTVIDREVEPGLPMSATSAIHEDPSGALWVGMDAGLAVRCALRAGPAGGRRARQPEPDRRRRRRGDLGGHGPRALPRPPGRAVC